MVEKASFNLGGLLRDLRFSMTRFITAGILLSFVSTLSLAQDASDFGAHSLPDGFAVGPRSDTSSFSNTGGISGTVVAVDGKPVFDVLVQLHNISTGSTLASAYTNIAGDFRFERVPYGRYEVVASHATSTIRENVDVENMLAVVNLHLGASDPNAPPAQNGLVSVAEYKVPRRAREAFQKAEEAIAHKRPEDVSKYVQKALDISPTYAPALTLRGALSLDRNDIGAAVDDFEKAIHADGTYALAYGAMAAALNRLGKFDEALRAGERASSLSPNSFQAYFEMAKSYAAKADYSRALQQLTHAQLVHEYAPLHLLRANVLVELKNYNDAADELKLFLKLAPNDPNSSAARDALGRINAFIASGVNTRTLSAGR
jgi:hypothetical protein